MQSHQFEVASHVQLSINLLYHIQITYIYVLRPTEIVLIIQYM